MTISDKSDSSENSSGKEWTENLKKESATRGDETFGWHPDKPGWEIRKDGERLAGGPLLVGEKTTLEKTVAREFARKGIALPVPLALLEKMEAKAEKDWAKARTEVPGWKTESG